MSAVQGAAQSPNSERIAQLYDPSYVCRVERFGDHAPVQVCIDSRMLQAEQATGVATYAQVLARCLPEAGAAAMVLDDAALNDGEARGGRAGRWLAALHDRPRLARFRQDAASGWQVLDVFREAQVDYYSNAAFLPRHRALFEAMFARLIASGGAMLVHCAAGKDRTGLAIALIQSALGVPRAAILAEYVRSNAALTEPGALDRARAHLHTLLGHDVPDFAITAFLGVSAHHLTAAFDGIEARCGSTDAYLDTLGLGPSERAVLRSKLG